MNRDYFLDHANRVFGFSPFFLILHSESNSIETESNSEV